MKIVKITLLILLSMALFAWILVWFSTYHPGERDSEPVACAPNTPKAKAGQTLSILSWNVQYMAGKDYVFFYDLLDGSGPDTRPSPAAIAKTFDEVTRIILAEKPDVILLQEIDDGAARTDKQDQMAELRRRLGETYGCAVSTFYWKASFVPHPKIMGAVGMKLGILSRYALKAEAVRHRLPVIPKSWLEEELGLKRAILEADLLLEDGGVFRLFNTHLDAFAQGTDTMERQVRILNDLLTRTSAAGIPWALGGDFNLLPPGIDPAVLGPINSQYYKPESEIKLLFDNPAVLPTVPPAEYRGKKGARWYTHFPNDPERASGPDRVIDYLFFDKRVSIEDYRVRAADTLRISDHLPMIAKIRLP